MSSEASQNMTRPGVPQWCEDAAAEIEAIWTATMRPSIAAIIAKHAPQRLPSAAESAERMYGYKPTGLNTIDALAAEGLYNATTPNNYACDPTHGSYLNDATTPKQEASGVERYVIYPNSVSTVGNGTYGSKRYLGEGTEVVTAADHDRICREKDAEIAELMCEIKDLQATNDDQGDALIAATKRAAAAEAKCAELEREKCESCDEIIHEAGELKAQLAAANEKLRAVEKERIKMLELANTILYSQSIKDIDRAASELQQALSQPKGGG